MKTQNIKDYINKLIGNDIIKIDMEFIDHIKLSPDEEKYLENTEEQRITRLKTAFDKNLILKECINDPKKAQNFHQYFRYYLEWYDLSTDDIGKLLKLKSKDLLFFYNVKNKITDFPVIDLVKIVKALKLNISDAIELIRNSFTLSSMKPNYGHALSRYHENESTDKGISLKNAMNELLMKSRQAKNIQFDEIESYLENFKRMFDE